MGYIHFNHHSTAHPETIFGYCVRPDRLGTWLTLLSHLGSADDRLDHVGASFTGDLKIAGSHLSSFWVVEEVTENAKILFHGTAQGGGEAKLWYRFSDWENGTEMHVELEYTLPGKFLSVLGNAIFVEKLIARDLRHSVETLVDICERHPEMLT